MCDQNRALLSSPAGRRRQALSDYGEADGGAAAQLAGRAGRQGEQGADRQWLFGTHSLLTSHVVKI